MSGSIKSEMNRTPPGYLGSTRIGQNATPTAL